MATIEALVHSLHTSNAQFHLFEAVRGQDAKEAFKQQRHISVIDSSCGSGATLIAAANELKVQGIDLFKESIFIGQDIDNIVSLICYIQLFTIGVKGFIVIGDAISEPITNNIINNLEVYDNIWIIP